MVFSSLLFVFWFIPIFCALYYIVPGRARNTVLFLGSIVFYAWGEPKFLILIFVSIIVNYIGGRMIERGRARSEVSNGEVKATGAMLAMIITLVFDFGMLFVFKYTDFFIENINSIFGMALSKTNLTLPLGISFYTFQIASYIIDLYRGKIKAEHNILNLGTYLIMFPQLIAGPIVVYSEVSEQLRERKITFDAVEDGLITFVIGLSSKVLIANRVGQLWDDIEMIGYENISTPLAWMGVISFSLQIYFDFNGYSLMAIGLGKMLGFDIPRNFNHPYVSKSLTEFWRRWHITLSSWFREYVYIPLGGNRKGTARTYVNLFIVWLLTGFWHGAGWNFILWGLFFFVALTIEKLWVKDWGDRHPIPAHIVTVILLGLSWMIFAITDMHDMRVFFGRLFAGEAATDCLYYLRNYGVIMILGCVLSTPLISRVFEKCRRKWTGAVITVILFVLCVAYLADESYNPFLYFRF